MEHQEQSKRSMFEGASPQLTFMFGIVSGVVAALVIGGFLIVPHLYSASKGGSKVSTASAGTTGGSAAAAAPSATAPSAPAGNVKAISKDDYIRGDKNAQLTLVEYGDLECPFCKQFHPTMQQVMTDYQGKVRWVYRQFPLSFHQNAQKEAEASLCAGSLGGQDKFWAFVDKVYERTTSNGTGFALTALGPLAKEVGVDQTKFQSCLDSGQMTAAVQAEEADGTAAGVNGTPTTFLVGADGKTITSIPGAYPYAQVKTTIDQALAKK